MLRGARWDLVDFVVVAVAVDSVVVPKYPLQPQSLAVNALDAFCVPLVSDYSRSRQVQASRHSDSL